MGIFDQLKQMGTNGLGLSGAVGTPGINPAAPDPRQAQGGGIGLAPAPQQTAEPQAPTAPAGPELPKFGLIPRLIISLGEGMAAARGQVGPWTRIQQQAQQQ